MNREQPVEEMDMSKEWNESRGFVVGAELVFIFVCMLCVAVIAWAAFSAKYSAEWADVGSGLNGLNQNYTKTGMAIVHPDPCMPALCEDPNQFFCFFDAEAATPPTCVQLVDENDNPINLGPFSLNGNHLEAIASACRILCPTNMICYDDELHYNRCVGMKSECNQLAFWDGPFFAIMRQDFTEEC